MSRGQRILPPRGTQTTSPLSQSPKQLVRSGALTGGQATLEITAMQAIAILRFRCYTVPVTPRLIKLVIELAGPACPPAYGMSPQLQSCGRSEAQEPPAPHASAARPQRIPLILTHHSSFLDRCLPRCPPRLPRNFEPFRYQIFRDRPGSGLREGVGMAERQAPASGQWLSDEDLQQVTKSSPRIRLAFHFSIPFASSPPCVISLLEGSTPTISWRRQRTLSPAVSRV